MIVFDLQRHMAITHVIRDARKLCDISGTDFMQRFVRRDDFYNATVLQRKFVTMREHGSDFELDTDFFAACQRYAHPRAFALIESELNRFVGLNLLRD